MVVVVVIVVVVVAAAQQKQRNDLVGIRESFDRNRQTPSQSATMLQNFVFGDGRKNARLGSRLTRKF